VPHRWVLVVPEVWMETTERCLDTASVGQASTGTTVLEVDRYDVVAGRKFQVQARRRSVSEFRFATLPATFVNRLFGEAARDEATVLLRTRARDPEAVAVVMPSTLGHIWVSRPRFHARRTRFARLTGW